MIQSGSCRDLASHGYLVFSMDHRDESSNFTVTKDGQELYYSNAKTAYDLEYRRSQLEIRERETVALIEEICSHNEILYDKLKF